MNTKPKDGGWGWLIVASTFISMFIRCSTVKVFAVLLPSIRDDLQLDTWVIGWLISLMLTTSDFTALPAAWLCSRSGHRLVVMTGGLMVAVGIVSSSLAGGVAHLLFSVLVTGIGMGLVENPPLAMIGNYFHNRYATANSLALSAIPIAIMLAPPVTQLLFDVFGWRGTLVIWGGTCLHLVVCGAVLRPVVIRGAAERDSLVGNHDEECSSESSDEQSSSEKGFWKQLVQSSHLYLVKSFSFLAVVCVLCFERLTFMAWMIYLVPHGIQAGLTPYQAATLPVGTGVANLVGKVLQGLSVDCKVITPTTLLCVTGLVAGTSLMLDPLTGTFRGMFILGVIYGFAVGALYPLAVTILKDLVGEVKFIIALGWYTMALGVLRTPMGFFPGWLYDVSGSYNIAFVVLGAIELIPVPLLVIESIRRSGWYRSYGEKSSRKDYERLTDDK